MIWQFWLEVHCLNFYACEMLTNTKMHAGWVPPCICIFDLFIPKNYIAFNLKRKIMKTGFGIENFSNFLPISIFVLLL